MVKSLSDVKWKEFAVDALFDISGSKTTPKNRLENIGNGKYPYVTTQTTSNGQAGYFNLYTEKGKVLTVDSAVAGFTTYQANNFSASDHVEILTPKFQINKYVALFLTVQFNKNNQKKFSYGYKACQDRLRKMSIILPVNSKVEPDYEFMEEYIKEHEAKLKEQYKNHVKARVAELTKEINPAQKWGDYKIQEIFPVLVPGKSKGLNHLKQTDTSGISYLGATNRNNGVLCFVEKNGNEHLIQKGNCIAFIRNGEGSMGYSIYKSEDFIATSDITLGYNKKLNRYSGMFITTIADRVRGKYSFNYKRSDSRLKKEILSLPVRVNGEPDYTYMENYMKYLEQKKLLEYLNYIK